MSSQEINKVKILTRQDMALILVGTELTQTVDPQKFTKFIDKIPDPWKQTPQRMQEESTDTTLWNSKLDDLGMFSYKPNEVNTGYTDTEKHQTPSIDQLHDDLAHVLNGATLEERPIEQGNEHRVWFSSDDKTVVKISLLPVHPKVVEERLPISRIVEKVFTIIGHKGIAHMRDSGIGEVKREDGKKQNYTYSAHEPIYEASNLADIENEAKTGRVKVFSFKEGLKKLNEHGIVIECDEFRIPGNFATIVTDNPQTGDKEAHQVFTDNLSLEAENVLDVNFLAGVSRAVSTMKDPEEETKVRRELGGYIVDLIKTWGKYIEQPEEYTRDTPVKREARILARKKNYNEYITNMGLLDDFPLFPISETNRTNVSSVA